jgi:two-component system, NarL family, nitrate/nitrite response regulator NarL
MGRLDRTPSRVHREGGSRLRAPDTTPPGDRPARILIVDRDRLCAETLQVVLEDQGMLVSVIGPSYALDEVPRRRPDLVVVNLDRDGAGMELGARLLERYGDLKVVAMTGTHEERTLRTSARLGFHGYLTKEGSISTFVSGVRAALNGRVVRARPSDGGNGGPQRPSLTARERQVLTMLVGGWGNREIARELSISPHTVRTHVQSILTKLQVHTRLEAGTWAMRHGVVSVPAGDSPGNGDGTA